jgi:predicted nucleic acid-binding Zn ribbon protein
LSQSYEGYKSKTKVSEEFVLSERKGMEQIPCSSKERNLLEYTEARYRRIPCLSLAVGALLAIFVFFGLQMHYLDICLHLPIQCSLVCMSVSNFLL